MLKNRYNNQTRNLKDKEYRINCYEEKINNSAAEIEYLKDNTVGKKILSPLAYVYIILKSGPSEIKTNIKLYNALKNSNCFDIGFYLTNYPDTTKSKICKYFSPELHYVCHGFNENRKFNKKYYANKKDLLKLLKTNISKK